MSEPRVPQVRSIPAGYVTSGGEASSGPGAVIPDAEAGGAGGEPGTAGGPAAGVRGPVRAGFAVDAAVFRQELVRAGQRDEPLTAAEHVRPTRTGLAAGPWMVRGAAAVPVLSVRGLSVIGVARAVRAQALVDGRARAAGLAAGAGAAVPGRADQEAFDAADRDLRRRLAAAGRPERALTVAEYLHQVRTGELPPAGRAAGDPAGGAAGPQSEASADAADARQAADAAGGGVAPAGSRVLSLRERSAIAVAREHRWDAAQSRAAPGNSAGAAWSAAAAAGEGAGAGLADVNGPGEAREADLGVSSGNGKGQIFVRGRIVRTVPEAQIVDALLEEALSLPDGEPS